MSAEPRFDIDFAEGWQAEKWVGDIREAMKFGSIEVKCDGKASETGNVYVEYQCKKQAGWEPSGLATSEAYLWVFVIGLNECAIVITRERLTELARRAFTYKTPDGKFPFRKEEKDGSHPTKGVVISVKKMIEALLRKDPDQII